MPNKGDLRFIVFGGCGFIGRHLVTYLIEEDLASYVRVIDKVPPQVAWLNEHDAAVMKNPRVEFRSANLINKGSVESSLEGASFDVAINVAGEMRPGQADAVYREGILDVTLNCANACAAAGVGRFVEISSGQISSSDKIALKEDIKGEPWTALAKYKLEAEKELANIPGLNYVILRPAIVYGISDRNGLCPRLLLGGIYKYLGERLRLLWDGKLRMNTIHVKDLVRAIVHLSQHSTHRLYHVVDDGDTSQGMLSDLVSEMFGIHHDFVGNVLSSLTKVDLAGAMEEVNDKLLTGWAAACREGKVENTPLSPYVTADLLAGHSLWLDGSRLKEEGFVLKHPSVNIPLLKEMLDDYIAMDLFPKNLLS